MTDIKQYNIFQSKYRPGDILVQTSSLEEFEIEAIIIRKHEIVYDLYFKTVSIEEIDNSEDWKLK